MQKSVVFLYTKGEREICQEREIMGFCSCQLKKIVKEVKEGLYDEKFKVRKAVTKDGTRRREDWAPKN